MSRLSETFDKHLIPAHIERTINGRSRRIEAKSIRYLAAELARVKEEAARLREALEAADEFLDTVTAFVGASGEEAHEMQDAIRAALAAASGSPDRQEAETG